LGLLSLSPGLPFNSTLLLVFKAGLALYGVAVTKFEWRLVPKEAATPEVGDNEVSGS